MFEIVITVMIVVSALLILARSIKRKSKAGCDCGSCAAHCSNYKK